MNSANSIQPKGLPPLLTESELEIGALLTRLADALTMELKSLEPPQLVGIATGGVWLAQWLHSTLGLAGDVAELDSSFHRDDFGMQGAAPRFGESSMPETLEGKDVLLVDDVLHTGRTARAALNSLFEYGRPNRVRLLVLADRMGRELPIQADIAACRIELPAQRRLRLTQGSGAEPDLRLVIEEGGA